MSNANCWINYNDKERYIIFISSNSEEHCYTNNVEHDSIVTGFRQNMYNIQTHTKTRRKETYNGAHTNKE